MRALYAALDIIGHGGHRDPAQELERLHVRLEPVGQRLGARGTRIRVVRAAEHGDENLRRLHFATVAIDDGNGVTGVIDEWA